MSIKQILSNSGYGGAVCDKFYDYYRLLIEWNEKINLTAITDEDEVAEAMYAHAESLRGEGD